MGINGNSDKKTDNCNDFKDQKVQETVRGKLSFRQRNLTTLKTNKAVEN